MMKKRPGAWVIDYCIKPGSAEEMETTMVCLKKFLEPISLQEKEPGEYGPSTTMKVQGPPPYTGYQLVPPSKNERFIYDRSESEHWKMWEYR